VLYLCINITNSSIRKDKINTNNRINLTKSQNKMCFLLVLRRLSTTFLLSHITITLLWSQLINTLYHILSSHPLQNSHHMCQWVIISHLPLMLMLKHIRNTKMVKCLRITRRTHSITLSLHSIWYKLIKTTIIIMVLSSCIVDTNRWYQRLV